MVDERDLGAQAVVGEGLLAAREGGVEEGAQVVQVGGVGVQVVEGVDGGGGGGVAGGGLAGEGRGEKGDVRAGDDQEDRVL